MIPGAWLKVQSYKNAKKEEEAGPKEREGPAHSYSGG